MYGPQDNDDSKPRKQIYKPLDTMQEAVVFSCGWHLKIIIWKTMHSYTYRRIIKTPDNHHASIVHGDKGNQQPQKLRNCLYF